MVHQTEKTPEKKQKGGTTPDRLRKAAEQGMEQHERDILAGGVKRRLNFGCKVGAPPPSYKLTDLHRHFLGIAPRVSHGAEQDCMALMRVVAALGPEFVTWANNHNQSFIDCIPMWTVQEKNSVIQ